MNYYDVLGVPKNASADDIKKAHRSLVMKFHPDRNKDPDAEARFKQISVAYDTLSDTAKKQIYDQSISGSTPFGDIFGSPFWNNGNVPTRGENIHIVLDITLKELLKDTKKAFSFVRRDPCDICRGMGLAQGKTRTTCRVCHGSGHTVRAYRHGPAHIREQTICTNCNGRGQSISASDACNSCNGVGTKNVTHQADVIVPAGMTVLHVIPVYQQGHCGSNNGGRGDVIVRLNIAQDRFDRYPNGTDLSLVLPISYVHACLGGPISVEMLDGSMQKLEIPPLCQNQRNFVIEKQGLPHIDSHQRGSLIVSVNLEVPKSLSPEQKELLEKLKLLEK